MWLEESANGTTAVPGTGWSPGSGAVFGPRQINRKSALALAGLRVQVPLFTIHRSVFPPSSCIRRIESTSIYTLFHKDIQPCVCRGIPLLAVPPPAHKYTPSPCPAHSVPCLPAPIIVHHTYQSPSLCPCMSCKPPTKHGVPLTPQNSHPNSRFPRSVDKYCAFFSPRFAAKNDFAVFGVLQPFCGVAEGACFCMLYRSVQSTNGRIEICIHPPAFQVMAGESFGGGRHLTPDFG